jgi:hypothetical protein
MTTQTIATDDIQALRICAGYRRNDTPPVGFSDHFSDGIGQGSGPRPGLGLASKSNSARERRKARRHEQQLPMSISVFNQSAFFAAQMVNYSQDGVCVETYQHILPGTSLHIRIDPDPLASAEEPLCHCFRTTALGEIKWCRAINQNPAPSYQLGIRYYPHY